MKPDKLDGRIAAGAVLVAAVLMVFDHPAIGLAAGVVAALWAMLLREDAPWRVWLAGLGIIGGAMSMIVLIGGVHRANVDRNLQQLLDGETAAHSADLTRLTSQVELLTGQQRAIQGTLDAEVESHRDTKSRLAETQTKLSDALAAYDAYKANHAEAAQQGTPTRISHMPRAALDGTEPIVGEWSADRPQYWFAGVDWVFDAMGRAYFHNPKDGSTNESSSHWRWRREADGTYRLSGAGAADADWFTIENGKLCSNDQDGQIMSFTRVQRP